MYSSDCALQLMAQLHTWRYLQNENCTIGQEHGNINLESRNQGEACE